MRKIVQSVAWASSVAMVAAPALALPGDFKSRADAILAEAFAADGPGAIAVVVEKGKPVYAAGRGLADIESKRPLDPAKPMRLGSITKQFTAAMVLKLVDEGKVALDDPLSKYLPDFPKPGADATIRQLLNHTSGIRSYTSIPGLLQARAATPHTTAEMIALFKDAPPTFERGSDWAYNNSGYVLLGAVIEKVTGEPWHVAIDQQMLKPLGLKSIRYGGLKGGEADVPVGYSRAGDKVVVSNRIDMSIPHAAGSLVGSATEVAAWGRALHQGKVIKPATYAQMITPTTLPSGRTVPYGFGLTPGDVRGRPSVGHDGGIFGFSTDGIYLPSEDIYVAVFANSDEPSTDPEVLTRKLAAAAIGDPYETFSAQPVDPKAVEPLLGIYRTGDVERRFFLRDGALFTQRSGNPPMAVKPGGGNRFFYPDSLSWFEIARSAEGKPVMRFHTNGETKASDVAYAGPIPPEAPPASVARADLERLAGTYQGPVPIVVAVNPAGVLTLKFGDQPVTHLVPESATTFRVKEVDARITFGLNDGKSTGLIITQGGRDLAAKRAD